MGSLNDVEYKALTNLLIKTSIRLTTGIHI